MERALRDKKAICFFVLPALIWFVGIAIVPVVQSVGYSFLDWNGISQGRNVGFANYKTLLADPLFWSSVKNSVMLAGASVFVQLPISMLLAMILVNGVRGETLYRNIFFIPVIISGTVIANLWMKVYHPSYGLLNVMLGHIGLERLQHEWLGSVDSALLACFVPMIWQYIGYHMLLYYSAAKSIGLDVMEAARVDGVNKRQMVFQIIIPQIMPMIKASVIFAIIGSLKSFDMIHILTRGGPVHASEVPSLLMYTHIFTTRQYGYASAIAIFIIVECLLFTFVVQKVFDKRRYD